jgi:hypothetical protein
MPLTLPPRVVTDAPARFRVDFEHLVRLLLPTLLRKPRLVNWLWALLSPLLDLYATFLTYRETTLRELSYNGQTLVLQECLNDSFDPYLSQRRIRIVNVDVELQPDYDNFRSEQQAQEQYMVFVQECPPWAYDRHQVEYDTQLDFLVWAPDQLNTPDLARRLRARVEQFRPAATRYALRFATPPYPLYIP